MSTAVVIRDPKAYVTPDVWEREVALLLRNPENTRELAEAKFGQAIAYLVTCGENPDLLMGPSKQVDEAWHSFMLDSIPYQDALPGPIELPPRPKQDRYKRPPKDEHIVIEERFWEHAPA